ncbi:MAG: beta strand repeat-containing protein [Limisphaerales bacterium]
MKGRWVACIYRGLTLLTILLFMTGMRAFGQFSLTNSTGITINNDTVNLGEALNGYPSTVTVPTNVAGNLEKVTVTLNNFTHGYPNDVVILLVAPNGSTVALMGNDGAGTIVKNLSLTFDDVATGAGTLGIATPLTSGTYKTGDNSPYGVTKTFPGLANLANATLASFVGATPANYEGTWSLYVLDDSQPNVGSIASWSLNLYTPAAIATANTSIALSENQSSNFFFTVSDTTSNTTLTPSVTINSASTGNIGYTNAAGSFPNVVSASDFLFSTINPNGTNTLTITPNANLYGTAIFTINLTDANSNVVSSQQINLTVNHVAVAPKISLPNTTITTSEGVASTTNFISLISLDGNSGSTLLFNVVGTNGIGNIGVNSNVFTNIVGLPAATPATIGITNNFYFSIVPGGFPIGTSYLNFIVTDPTANLSATQTVTVIVNPLTNGPLAGPLVYANTNAITIQPGTGVPLGAITITNLADIGLIGRASVSILGLTNVIPSGLQASLVAPDGTVVILLQDPTGAGSSPSTYAELTFADSVGVPNVQGPNVLPAATPSNGSDLLTNYVLNALDGSSTFAALLGGHSLTNTGAANVWMLWVGNYSSSPFGVSGGWVLDVYPAPVLAEPAQASITMPESASTNIVFVTSDTVGVPSGPPVVTFNPSINPNYSDTALTKATVLASGSSATINGTNFTVGSAIIGGTNYTTNIVNLTANPNEAGTAVVTVVVTETNGLAGSPVSSAFTATNSFQLTVSFVAQAPSISFIENQVTFAGAPVFNIPFVISSPDTNATALSVTVSSSNPNLLPTSQFQNNAVVTRGPSSGSPPSTTPAGSASVETNYLTLFPVGVKASQSTITVTVSDGQNTVSTNFLLIVDQPGSPLFYNPNSIANITPNTNGTPYPSSVSVQNLVGTVENVVVTVFDVTYLNAAGLNLILVGPTNAAGQSPAVYLMGDAGGATALTSANLIFSNSIASLPDTNAVVLPFNGQISSDDIYIPTNYAANGYTTQIPIGSASVAPPAPGVTGYGTNLVSSFAGINPNGTWSLYAFDTNGVKGGAIFGGWQLSILTAPHVSPTTTNYTALEGFAPTNILIPVGDAEADNTSLTVTATVTSPTSPSITVASPIFVTNNGVANLAVLNVSSVPYQYGTNNISILVTDASGITSTANLQFVVAFSAQPPVILVTNTSFSTPAGIPISGITFAVWDAQSTNNNKISVSFTGLNPQPAYTVSPLAFENGTNSYTLTVQPVGVETGSATITIAVTDVDNQSAKTNLSLVITPNQVYESSAPIYLGPGAPAQPLSSPYPSGITVSGVGGFVSGVQVSLIGFTHNSPEDVDVLLVSPDGKHSVVLMADAGYTNGVNNLDLEFSQTAGAPVPQLSTLTSGTYQPANYVSPANSLVFPTVSGPYSASLSAFDGVQPNGTWNLYVLDSGYPDSGEIANWLLYLQTGPSIAAIPTQKVGENSTLNLPVTITDSSAGLNNVTVTITNLGGAVLTSNSTPVAVTQQGAGSPTGVTNLVITPEIDFPSTTQTGNYSNVFFVTVSDGSGNSATTSFTLIVAYLNQPPVATQSSTNLVVNENGTIPITFTVSDVDSFLSSNNISLVSTDPGLVAGSGIVNTIDDVTTALTPGKLATVTYQITPVANTFGTNQGALLFSVSDTNGNTVTLSTTVSVSHVIQTPIIAPFTGHYQQFAGTTTNIPFSVSTVESNATLLITASSSNPNVVPNSPLNIIINPSSISNGAPSAYSGTIELIIPSGALAGSSIITVTNTQVTAVSTNFVTTTFTNVVLSSPTAVFANTQPIANNVTNGEASPYPSTVTVTNEIGGIYTVAVTLNAFSASDPKDVSILLSAPNKTSVLLLSDAGGTAASQNLTLTFSDTAGLPPANSPLAANGGSVSYHATGNNGNNNALPTNAPPLPYFDRLAVFDGLSGANLNGVWSLWVVDNTTGNTVSISNGWALSITTAPEITLETNELVIPENGAQLGNQGSLSLNIIDGSGGAVSDNLLISSSPASISSLFSSVVPSITSSSSTNAAYTVTFTPTAFVTGTNTITFTATRVDGGFGVATATIAIVKSNIPPVLTRLGPIGVAENVSGLTEFFVTESGDPLSDVTIAAYSGNPAVIATSNLTFSTGSTAITPGTFNTNVVNLANFASSVANAGDVVLNLLPNPNVVGSATITVYVTNADGAFNSPQVVSNSFALTVIPQAYNPTFTNTPPAPPAVVSIIQGTTNFISFQVTSADTILPQITVTATNLTAGSGISIGVGPVAQTAGSTWTVPIIVGASASKAQIQLNALDSNGRTASTVFVVNPVPPEQHTFSNTNAIQIVDAAPSVPSPSPITVSNLVGSISQVIVTVNGFSHQYSSDVGILLVGPNGSNTVLMNNAGSDFGVSGLTLTFSTNAAGPAPDLQSQGPLASTIYLPSDYQPVKPYNFETNGAQNPPPPNGPYPTNLTVFNGSNPNGTWYLYVQDDSPGGAGSISQGWSLQIITQPTIELTSSTPVLFPENSVSGGSTSFSILDDSLAGSISYTPGSFGVTSSNAAVIPPGNVSFSGSGTTWTASYTNAPDVAGTTLLTIYSTNIYGQVASASFGVTVTSVPFPPTISQPAIGSVVTVAAGTPTLVPLVYGDVGYTTATNTLIVSASSLALGAQNPVPSSSLSFVGNGAGPSNLVVTPVGNLTGSNLITLTVSQPIANGLSATETFILVVGPSTVPVFANTNPITINAAGPASLYPSQITVAGVGSDIAKVTATLVGFAHTFPSDVSALLVGPGGQSAMLMSDEGFGIGVSNLRLTFDDAGGAMSPNGPLTSGTNAPALSDLNFIKDLPDVILPNAPSNSPPSPAYYHNLSVFSNTAPNGVWSLYVYDNSTPDVGLISGGWSLDIETIGPMITPLAPVTINENTSITIPFSIASIFAPASNITVAASASGEIPSNLVSSLVIEGAGTSNETLTITPTPNYPSAVYTGNGMATITLTLTDTNHNYSSTNSFPLTVVYEALTPILGPIPDTNMTANIPLNIVLQVADSAVAVSNLIYSANIGNPSVIQAVDFSFNGTNEIATIVPVSKQSGSSLVTINVSDGKTNVTQSFTVTVVLPPPPVLGFIALQQTPENTSTNVVLPVTDSVIPISNLTYSATIQHSNLIQAVNFSFDGANEIATIIPVPYQSGVSAVTISVSDGVNPAVSDTFYVDVTFVEYPPTLAPIPTTNTTANTPLNLMLGVTNPAGSALTYSASIVNPSVISAVNFSAVGSNEFASIVPVANAIGSSSITLTVSDGITNASETFVINVMLPPPPVLGTIFSLAIPENTSTNLVLPVSDSVTPISNLTYTAIIPSPSVVATIKFIYIGTNEVATIIPVANQVGASLITIVVSDGLNPAVSNTFGVTVEQVELPPVLAPIPNTNTPVNTPVSVTLQVTDALTTINNLFYSATIANTNIIGAVNFSFNGTSEIATVVPVTNKVGLSGITITVGDGVTNVSQSFNVTVTQVAGPALTATVASGQLKITFTGTPGVTYTIQSSSDLETWTTAGTATASAGTGAAQYIATVSSTGAAYYRAVAQ